MKNVLRLLLFVLAVPLSAQTPYLVKDINTTFAAHRESSQPTSFARFGNRIYFTATTEKEGTELWSSDGTSDGTRIVSDLIPGSGSSNPGPLIVVNGTALFQARDVNHGIEWWTTDGTAAGTHLFMDLNPGPSSSQPFAGIFYNNKLLFTADDGVNGRELWSTDGTVAGTRMVKDVAPGSTNSSPGSFRLFKGQIYFYVPGALWKTDGTEAGTVKVANVTMRNSAVIGSLLFFEGWTATTGYEPWVSDGTEAGTRMLTELIPGTKGGFDSQYSFLSMIALGSRAIFLADDGVHGRELWSSDGTVAGTRMIREFLPGAKGAWDTNYLLPVLFGNRVVFTAKDDEHGTELWGTDGTEQGTALLLDVVPGTGSSNPNSLTVSGDKLFFTGSHPDVPNEVMLYVTDGTAAGTRVLNKGDGGNRRFDLFSSLWPVDGKIYFAASDVLHATEPWVSDGTEAGTEMFANLAADEAPSAYPYYLTPAGNLLYFVATDGVQNNGVSLGLWRTDGTAAGTFRLLTMDDAWEPVRVGSLVMLQQRYNYRTPQFITDGTTAGTQPIAGFLSRFGSPTSTSRFEAFFPFGDTLFAVLDSMLWKTTAAMNAPAIQLGTSARGPFGLVDFGGRQIFWAQAKGIYDYGLWITDGTPAGTYAIVPYIGDTSSQRPSDLTVAGGTIFFAKTLRDEQTKLWKSDGTLDGTTIVKEAPSGVAQLKGAGRKVFFVDGNKSLWASDGTEAGTIELMKVDFSFSYQPNDLRPLGDRMLFVTRTTANEYELWASDGTKDGTKLLRKLGPNIGNLSVVDGLAYFGAPDPDHGVEPWVTDGTPEGTKMLFDLNPGAEGSDPSGFARVGNLLYFAGYTDAVGNELWALPLTQSQLSIGDTHVSEGDSGTGTAHFTVTLAPAAKQSVAVDFATGDGTARAGEDYDAATGTLIFAPGETTKTIDVRVRGDAAVENNETFAVTLRNPAGAILARREAFAVIDDEEQLADLKVELTPNTDSSSLPDMVTVSDLGPRSATDVKVTFTGTPGTLDYDCYPCVASQLANGQTTRAYQRMFGSGAMYKSAIVTARQPDPQSINNTAGWVITQQSEMIMYGLYLNPGGSTAVSLANYGGVTAMGLQSSDPTVVSVASTVTFPSTSTLRTNFTITALKPGTAKITAASPQYGPLPNPLPVTVVAAGTTPRWPIGMFAQLDFPTGTRLDLSTRLKVTLQGTAPLTGASPTGVITVSRSGHELARKTLAGAGPAFIDFYPDDWGQLTFDVSYAGDATFLPQAQTLVVFIGKGAVTLTGGLERSLSTAGTFTLRVRAQGSPVRPPTGTITVTRNGTLLATLPLTAAGDQSSATATLSNLPVSPTITVSYSGDGVYNASTQELRVIEPHRRPVGH